MTRNTRLLSSLMVLAGVLSSAPIQAQTVNTYDYWLMPLGLVAQTQNKLWSGATVPGQHCFWRGTKWGRTVALQGDPSMTRYDIMVDTGSRLDYWGTFRGNALTDQVSHSFDSPFFWMDKTMSVGQVKENAFTVRTLDSKLRRQVSSGTVTMRMEINALLSSYTIPETGVTYFDVLKVTFFSDKNVPASKEIYFLAKGKGTIRFETFNSGEPSGVHFSWATSFQNQTIASPTLPWFDPFLTVSGKKTAVLNGFFEDMKASPVNGGTVNTYLRSWTGTSNDVVITTDGTIPGGSGSWKIAARGTSGGGDAVADAATSDWIPVTGGRTYRLSGWLWRVSSTDNVYLDFNDGMAIGTGFVDQQAVSTATNQWQLRSATVTLPAGTLQIKVRCVRDGLNQGNAYFDGILLERLN